MIDYEDFSVKIEPMRGDTYPVIVLRSPAGEGRSAFRLPFDPDSLGDLLVDLGQSVRGPDRPATREASPGATRTRPQQIGDQLFNALFSGPARSLLDQSLGMIRERQHALRIKLHIDPEDPSLARLAPLPWEPMYRKEYEIRQGIFDAFDRGREDFYKGRFETAVSHFAEIAKFDSAAASYLEKCRELIPTSPTDWDGVWVMTRK